MHFAGITKASSSVGAAGPLASASAAFPLRSLFPYAGHSLNPLPREARQARPNGLCGHSLLAGADFRGRPLRVGHVPLPARSKPEYNQINEEPIFLPRPLAFRFFKCRARFIALRGREDNFAALASTGQLYVWGLSARGLLADDIQLPSAWRGNHVYEPVLQTDFLPHRVRDFSV